VYARTHTAGREPVYWIEYWYRHHPPRLPPPGRAARDFYTPWRGACTEAKVPGHLFDDLRRTAVRNLERAGVPRSWATKLTGLKTEAVYRRYAIVSEADLRDAVGRRAALATGTKPARIATSAAAAENCRDA
jgi:hypothetical protein